MLLFRIERRNKKMARKILAILDGNAHTFEKVFAFLFIS